MANIDIERLREHSRQPKEELNVAQAKFIVDKQSNHITVEAFDWLGSKYMQKRRMDSLITITIDGKKQFSGTMDELKAILNKD